MLRGGVGPDAGDDDGRTDDAVDAVLRRCVHGSLPGHGINDLGFLQPARGMNAIGG